MSPSSIVQKLKQKLSPPKGFRFLDLPPDVRNIIYDYCTIAETATFTQPPTDTANNKKEPRLKKALKKLKQALKKSKLALKKLKQAFKKSEQALNKSELKLPSGRHQYYGLALVSVQLRREFRPMYMRKTKIHVTLPEMSLFLDTFLKDATETSQYDMVIEMIGGRNPVPVDILPIIRWKCKAPNLPFRFYSKFADYPSSFDLLDMIIVQEMEFWVSLMDREGAVMYLTMMLGYWVYIKKTLDDKDWTNDFVGDGLYWTALMDEDIFVGDAVWLD